MNKYKSIFGQITDLISRIEFERLAKETNSSKGIKGFNCWDQFISMLFCQLGGANSLREICNGLSTSLGKLKHLGMKGAPKRSTLSYANEHRSYTLYERLFYILLERYRMEIGGGKHKFRFKNSHNRGPK